VFVVAAFVVDFVTVALSFEIMAERIVNCRIENRKIPKALTHGQSELFNHMTTVPTARKYKIVE